MHSTTRNVRLLLLALVWGTASRCRTLSTTADRSGSVWGASDSMQYSALAQINKERQALQRAWFYAVPGEPDRLVSSAHRRHVMYVSVCAACSSRSMPRPVKARVSTLQATERGLAYWESKDRSESGLILTASHVSARSMPHRNKSPRLSPTASSTCARVSSAHAVRTTAPAACSKTSSSSDRTSGRLWFTPRLHRAYDVTTKLAWTSHDSSSGRIRVRDVAA